MTEQTTPTEKKDVPSRRGFSAEDDAFIMWFFYCCQYSDKNILTTALKITIRQAYDRFLEVKNNPILKDRCLNYVKNNLFSFKPVPISRLDLYYYSKIKRTLNILDQNQIMEKFPLLFHPAISPLEMHKKTITSPDSLNLGIEGYITETQQSVEGLELEPFPGNFADPVEEVRKLMDQQVDIEQVNIKKEIDSLIANAFNDAPPKTYAALIGQFCIHYIDKAVVKIGRNSPKIKVDIDVEDTEKNDLSKISRHHCTLFLAKDLKFYIKIFGKTIIINGELFNQDQVILMKNHDIIDIGGQPLIFVENQEIMSKIRSL